MHAYRQCLSLDCLAFRAKYIVKYLPAMPLFCLGYRGAACTLSRKNPGGEISMRYPCSICHQQRCRSHCRCARDGSASGKAAGRPAPAAHAKAQPKAQPKAVATSPRPPQVVAVAPVGRASALHVEVLGTAAWWASLLQAVGGARF